MILIAKPTIPPMTRQPYSNTIPDYIVTNEYAIERGYGAVLTTGFWRWDWKWRETTSFVSVDCKHNEIKAGDKIEL